MNSIHPYKDLPDSAFWRRSVTDLAPEKIDPAINFNLRIKPNTKVATAGSCFAQHISHHLHKAGFNYYITEPGHPIIPEQIRRKHNYGVFSARYGNIYTTRQLLQLFYRAYGQFVPKEEPWIEADGTVRDPFRPTVQPRGFISAEEMLADREQHLTAVRLMFETLDVFIFTLGLTECWMSSEDGAVFPICPGVDGGQFNKDKYIFYNQDVTDVIADLNKFITALKKINNNAEIILTVSPVPLVATAEPNTHVLSATTYSKSVLRVAAEMMKKQHNYVHYFPSYEIITGAFSCGRYYDETLRNVTPEGVNHVMKVFLNNITHNLAESQIGIIEDNSMDSEVVKKNIQYLSHASELIELECDEVALER
ncbi:TPA: GSCFA domain-containing protein [Legionella pneumophila]|nr:GSCFA domain-containing protein [Legionella pneumophila]HDV5842729.1 GSCFA domain-containing protein [Legionella pneumophila]HDV5849027.1 GSCFA domain-containing protein [Legionella pneumophila]